MDQNELMNIINNVGNDVTGNVDISLKNDNDEYHVVKIPLMKPRVEELETLQKDYGIDITEERWDDIDKHTDVVYLIGLMKIKFLIDAKENAWDILDKYREEILNEMSFDDICQLTGFDVGMGYYQTYRYLYDNEQMDTQFFNKTKNICRHPAYICSYLIFNYTYNICPYRPTLPF